MMSFLAGINTISNVLEKVLIAISLTILLSLSAIIIVAVFSRFSGASLYWYDEVSAILLAWLTFYGSALCALKRSHMGFGGLVASLSLGVRKLVFLLSEFIVIAFFVVMAWASYYLLEIFGDETLTSLEFITLSFAQSALPIGAVLFVVAQLCSFPKAWEMVCKGSTQEEEEIQDAIRDAKKDMAEVMEVVK
ncbi:MULTISPECIES: TRAP transporter small permease [Vibrio]|uniref:TRAP transporter small permease protein n=1 Tax=Vibrio qingdaonensis TaxID=2829491 RepID=A0A9X3HW32_9VIBR|nr:TRAP transporter small permease [Vibrio qingdaonensis]MCW8345874.1 TRAP transporter small permease [Vibrio qingdaonensis]